MTETELFRIKPLEWADHSNDMRGLYVSQIAAPLADFRIYRGRRRCEHEHCESEAHQWDSWRLYYTLGSDDQDDEHCTSPEEGRQLAEAHWREYIKQALLEAK